MPEQQKRDHMILSTESFVSPHAASTAPMARRQLKGALRRYTLVLLRWGAVLGQTAAVLIVAQILEFNIQVCPSLVVIGLAALLNIAISLSLPLDRRVSDIEAISQLSFDVLQLGLLLYLNGGIENPFALLFLAPVVTSATTLSKRVMVTVAVMALIAATILLFWHQPLPWFQGVVFKLPPIYDFGMLTAVFVGTIFTSLYAWRTTTESRIMSAALSATEQRLAQEQKLSALGSLAAAAAHELGTPLATIAVTAKEMTLELPEGPLADDAALVLEQAQRCRAILEQLALRGDTPDLIHETLSLEDLLEEAADGFIYHDKEVVIESHQINGANPLIIRRRPELLYALKNFTENAVDFAKTRIELTAQADAQSVFITIDDDGPGFDPIIRTRLGQPYVTSRAKSGSAGGLGLGVFIAATLVERTGGQVYFEVSPNQGARIRCVWPTERLIA